MLMKERRNRRRRACLIPVDCVGDNQSYKAFIVDISSTGAFLESHRPIHWGQEITMTFPHPASYEDVSVIGRVVWAGGKGFGVRFNRLAPKKEEASQRDSQGDEKKSSGIGRAVAHKGKIRKKKIRWKRPASSDVVKYMLYWSKDGEVTYNSQCVDVGNVTEIVLPEGVPSFPLVKGTMTLGVSALNNAGNESDITKTTAQLDFVVPEPPDDLRVEVLQD